MSFPSVLMGVSLLGILGLSACTPGIIVTETAYRHTEIRDVFRYVVNDRPLRVMVLGNPTRDTNDRFSETIRDVVAAAGTLPGTYTLVAAPDREDRYRFVIAFPGSGGYGPDDACRDVSMVEVGGGRGDLGGGRFVLVAAFCVDERVLSSTRVDFPGGTSSADPVFGQAVGAAVRALVPMYDPDPRTPNGLRVE
jgi:hypothetical protein